jgi:hypothetical protein
MEGEAADPTAIAIDIAPTTYPALFQVADASSVAGQQSYRRFVQIELSFVLVGAALGGIGAFADASLKPLLASLASACLIGSIAMKLVNRQSGSDQRWFDGRAVAETVKTQAWRFMMRVSPYEDDRTAESRFAADVLSAIRARPELQQPLELLPETASQISDAMRAVRTLRLVERRTLYIVRRVNDQASWYRNRAIANRANGRRWFWVSLAGQVVAAGIALASIFAPEAPAANLVGLFAALAATATAWTQLGRHDELSKAYALAYQELITIRTVADRVETEPDLDQLVTTGEAAISREHTMWMAKLGRGRSEAAHDQGVA